MSNLYVRLHSSFWTHRKTLQLRRKLGDAAFWIPPRLWSFAAENAPDGDLSNYQADDLAMLVQYSGNAQEMLQALNDAGFLENGIIRNWEERNAFHVTNHKRAKKAAAARWADQNEKLSEEKERDKEKEKESKQAQSKHCLADAPSISPSPKKKDTAAPKSPSVRFQKPTVEELTAEAIKIGLPLPEVDKFLNYYESNGWKVGKNSMKSWPATMKGWLSRIGEASGLVGCKGAEKSDVDWRKSL